MIPLEKFRDAEKYLQMWIGRLNNRPSVQKKVPDAVRKRRIAFIPVNMKKLDCEETVRGYMEKNFSVRSLTELDMKQLDRVYHYVSSIKSRTT